MRLKKTTTTALNVLYVLPSNEEIRHAYKSNHNLKHCSIDATKNTLDYHRGKKCMKNF